MEIKQYLLLIRKWAWLLILGGILGGVIGLIYSYMQPTLYRSSTTVMVSQTPDDYRFESFYQIYESFVPLFTSNQVIEQLSGQLGYEVSSGQIDVDADSETSLISISVTDDEPSKTAEIANSMVDVFSDYIETQVGSRFEVSEQSLQDQITRVEQQITAIQEEISQASQLDVVQQQEQSQQQIVELKNQLDQTEAEIIKVEGDLEAFFPIPLPTSTPQTNFSPTPTPVPTPTLAPAALVDYKETQNRLDQLRTVRDLYKQAYSNLLVLGEGQNFEGSSRQIRQEQLFNTLSLYEELYADLLANYEEIRIARQNEMFVLVQLKPASIPSNPFQPQPFRTTAMGFVAGIFIAGIIAYLFEYLDDSLKTPEDVQLYLDIPVIGMIGEMDAVNQDGHGPSNSLFVADNPLSPVSEAFRSLRANLDYSSVDKPLKSILITSANPSEGKTSIAVNLAVVIAQRDKRVILVDADLRRPALHHLFNLQNRKGFSDLFTSSIPYTEVSHSWDKPHMQVITSGALPPNPSELLSSKRMQNILDELKTNSDIVILDTPPIILSDPFVLSRIVDGVLVVITPGKTSIGQSQAMIEQMQRAGANILGAVLNPVTRQGSYYYSRYDYIKKDYGYFPDSKKGKGKFSRFPKFW